MILSEIIINNSVRYIPKSEKDTTKNRKESEKVQPVSGGGKPNKKISKSIKKFVKDFTAGGLAILK